jgi:hypothetical protein
MAGKKKPLAWLQAPMLQVSDKSEPPHLLTAFEGPFQEAIGKLIIDWAMMELQMNILIWALLKANGTNEPNWRVRPFEKRYALLQNEWTKFSDGFEKLPDFLKSAYADVRTAKVLRDSISHKEIVFGVAEKGERLIQFYNKTRAKQKSRSYSVSDFRDASSAALRAAGSFYWVAESDSNWPLPSPDKQRLRSLPSTDHLRIPT